MILRRSLTSPVQIPFTFEQPVTLGKSGGTSGSLTFIASDGDTANIAINTSDQLVFSGASGGYSFDNTLFGLTARFTTFQVLGGSGSLFNLTQNDVVSNSANSYIFNTDGNPGGIGGGLYGHLVFQPRSSASRDIIFTVGSPNPTEIFRLTGSNEILANQDLRPKTDNTFYIGKNSLVSPLAWKGLILKDTTDGNYYRIETINGVVTATILV